MNTCSDDDKAGLQQQETSAVAAWMCDDNTVKYICLRDTLNTYKTIYLISGLDLP